MFCILVMTSVYGTFDFRWWEGIVAELNDLDPSKATIYFPGLKTSQILAGCSNIYLRVSENCEGISPGFLRK